MANIIHLYRRFNGTFELEINSLMAKTDFTNKEYPAVLTEIHTYLATDEGKARLSGIFVDPGISTIFYSHSSEDSSAIKDYNIQFIDQKL